MLATLVADLRLALRRWRYRPGFAVMAVATLALGIAATTAIFSIVDAVLLRPLPWPDADGLAGIYAAEPERLQRPASADTWDRAPVHWREWEALQKSPAFRSVAAWMPTQFLYTGDRGPELVDGLYVSSNLLQTLGVRPHLGRMFTAEEDRAAGADSVMLSYEWWLRRFGGDEAVVGQPIAVGLGPSSRGQPRTIVGVLPPRLRFQGQAPEIVLPLGLMAHNLSFTSRHLRLLGRLAPGVSHDAAQGAAAPRVGPIETSAQRSARVVPLIEEEIGGAARPLWLLFGSAALLLLVACSNVAGLLLGEARARRHEMAVRISLGGGSGRILRQLVVEQMLLSTVAAAAGVVLALWLTPALVALSPERLPRLDAVAVDLRIAAFGFGVGVLTSLVFSLAPAVLLARTPAALVLAEGSRHGSARRTIGQRLVVAGEIALALVLATGASLFAETIARLTAQPLGFDPERLIVVSLSEAARPYTEEEWQGILNRRNDPSTPRSVPSRVSREIVRRIRERHLARTTSILSRLSAVPGVVRVAGATAAPFAATPPDTRVRRPTQPPEEGMLASWYAVTHDYFRALGLPIVRGRGFDDSDGLADRRAVISRELERQVFDGSGVGQMVALGTTPAAQSRTYEVVGVAENARQREYTDARRPAIYVLDGYGSTIANTRVGHVLVRTSGTPAALVPLVRQTLQAADDPPLAVTSVETMEELVAGTVAEPRFRAVLATVFGAAALVLVAVGIYGLAARRVEERRREIGVRIALGAGRHDVRRLVFGDASRTLALGVAVGLPAAVAVSQVTRAFLFGVSPAAPHTFVVASAVLAATALVATLVPARRASSADPMITLRE